MKRFCLAALFAVILLASCDFPPTFGAEYRDSERNFLADRALELPPPETDWGAATALDAPGIWDWGWRGRTNSNYAYATFVQSLEPGPAGQQVWLLTLANLSVNAVCSTTSGFTANGTSNITNEARIDSQSLKINASGTTGYVSINSALFADNDATTKNYQLSFMADNAGSFRFYSGSAFSTSELQNPGWLSSGFFVLPYLISTAPLNHNAIYTNGADVYIDDLLAVRADINIRFWSLRMILRHSDTSPVLVPGLYEFAVWVKKPAGYTYPVETGGDGSTNYASRFVTLRMVRLADNATLAEETFDLSSLPAGWNLLKVRIPQNKSLDFSETDDEPILSVEILPLDPLRPSPGAVLIAEPTLRFYINGY